VHCPSIPKDATSPNTLGGGGGGGRAKRLGGGEGKWGDDEGRIK